MAVTLRPATVEDVSLLQGYMSGLYAGDDAPPDPSAWTAALQRLLADARWGRAWIICQDGQPAGYVVITFGYSLEFYGRDAFVDELYVDGPFRGQGIARQAMALVEAQALVDGISALHLEVEEDNLAAQRLYESNGFRYRQQMHLMSKRLGGRENAEG